MSKDEFASTKYPVHHLDSDSGESWMGLIDGVYAIAMTLIAIELPELIISLVSLREKNIGAELISILIGYEFIAYTITFLMLYELWAVHKSILKIGGLKQKIQSLLNSLILSLTSLGAGNIILLLNEKTKAVTSQINPKSTGIELLHDWVSNHEALGLVTMLMLALMFFLMSLLCCSCDSHDESQDLQLLTRQLRIRSSYFLGSSLFWIPVAFGRPVPFPPALLVILFLFLSFNQDAIDAFLRRWRSHT
ncbi:MAG: TMEM175 family protein [Cyanobacteriota bacterium]|nr:TMEM175 family protein [Cyanobacteriota bacterium]